MILSFQKPFELAQNKDPRSHARDESETIRNAIVCRSGESGVPDDTDSVEGPSESPKHIVNKSDHDVAQIRAALKNDIVMKKLSKGRNKKLDVIL